MFKKKDKVVYPRHGAGEIDCIFEYSLSGKKTKYYKIKFNNSSIFVSVPVDKARELGLRCHETKETIEKCLKKLGEKVKITKRTLVSLDTVSKEKLDSGKFEDMVSLVNLLRSLAKQKEEENKNFSYSYSDTLEIAFEFLNSEVEMVLGKRALNKYPQLSLDWRKKG